MRVTKEFEIGADQIPHMREIAGRLVEEWVQELKADGHKVLSPAISLELVRAEFPMDPRFVRFEASLEVEKLEEATHIRWLNSKNPLCLVPGQSDFVLHALGDNVCPRCMDVLQWRYKAKT